MTAIVLPPGDRIEGGCGGTLQDGLLRAGRQRGDVVLLQVLILQLSIRHDLVR